MMKIRGIATGDSECWCFLVTRHTYIKVTGRKPSRYDIGRSAKAGNPYRYRLYPCHLIGFDLGDKVISLEVNAVVLGPIPVKRRGSQLKNSGVRVQ